MLKDTYKYRYLKKEGKIAKKGNKNLNLSKFIFFKICKFIKILILNRLVKRFLAYSEGG